MAAETAPRAAACPLTAVAVVPVSGAKLVAWAAPASEDRRQRSADPSRREEYVAPFHSLIRPSAWSELNLSPQERLLVTETVCGEEVFVPMPHPPHA